MQRLGAWFFAIFGLVGVMLSLGAIFGFVSYLAEAHRGEFGIRLALGASRSAILWMAMLNGLCPVAAGTILGLLGAAVSARILAPSLPGVAAVDAIAYASSALVILGTAGGSSFVAAWRLLSIDPAEPLRSR